MLYKINSFSRSFLTDLEYNMIQFTFNRNTCCIREKVLVYEGIIEATDQFQKKENRIYADKKGIQM